MLDEIVWTGDARNALLRCARAAAPRECAALLGGARDGTAVTVTELVELANVATTDDAFEVTPAAFAAAENALRERGAELVGFAHSHPSGACAPSARDRAELWTGCVQAITDGDAVQAFWLTADRAVLPMRSCTMEASR